MDSDRPIRILHVVTHMGPVGGGVPVWLMQVLRRINRSKYQFDFMVHTDEPQPFDAEVESLGGRILRCPSPKHIWKYSGAFRRAVQSGEPYQICHSHVLFAGHVLRQARKSGIPIRIAHSHSDRGGFAADGHWLHGAYLAWTNRWIHRDATHGLACSRRAAAALFGNHWDRDPRWGLQYYGIDLTPFRSSRESSTTRQELGIPPHALVIGHVGRFQPQKNHDLLFRIIAELIRIRPNIRLLLIGDGPMRRELERRASSLGIANAVVWAGVRSDVPRLMCEAMDVFVLTSFYEGLPLVGIEAQAAGLPLVITDAIASELDVLPNVTRLSVSVEPSRWAEAILESLAKPRINRRESIQAVADRFDLDLTIRTLTEFYDRISV